MKKQVLTLGLFALMALAPAGKVLAGGEDPCVISASGHAITKDGKITVTVMGEFKQGNVNITPIKGFSVSKIDFGQGQIMVTLNTNINLGSKHVNKDDGMVDVITIIGVDNIAGVFVDDGGSSSGAGGSYRHMVIDNDNDGGDTAGEDDGSMEKDSGTPTTGLGTTTTQTHTSNAKSDHGFTVYPNPVGDEANIITEGEILGKSIEVVDLSGRTRMNMKVQNSDRFSVNVSDLTPGIYMIILRTEDGKSFVQRISKR